MLQRRCLYVDRQTFALFLTMCPANTRSSLCICPRSSGAQVSDPERDVSGFILVRCGAHRTVLDIEVAMKFGLPLRHRPFRGQFPRAFVKAWKRCILPVSLNNAVRGYKAILGFHEQRTPGYCLVSPAANQIHLSIGARW